MFNKNKFKLLIAGLICVTGGCLLLGVSPIQAAKQLISNTNKILQSSSSSIQTMASKTSTIKSNIIQSYTNAKTEAEATPEPTVPASLDGTVTSSWTSAATTSSVTLQWDAVTDADGYTLALSYNNSTVNMDVTDTSYTLTDLSPATVINYTVSYYKTILGQNVYSSPSSTYTTSTSADKVTGLTILGRTSPTDIDAQVALKWDSMGDASYNIYYKFADETEYTKYDTVTTNACTISALTASTDYSFYVQAYCLNEDNTGEASDTIDTTTIPATVSNFTLDKETETEIDLSWDANPTGDVFYIYRSVNDSEYELYLATGSTSLADTALTPGTVYSYKICSYLTRADITGTLTDPIRAVTTPTVTTGLTVNDNSDTTLTLSWDANASATGYMIYRRKGSGRFVYLTSTSDTAYIDTELSSGTNYRYKIMTYADTQEHTSNFGNAFKTSTLPSQVIAKGKAGYGKLRVSWAKVTGASGYYIYELVNGEFTLIDTIEGNATFAKEYTSMTVGTTYAYKVAAYRVAFEQTFVGTASAQKNITPAKTKATSTTPTYYKTKKALINSAGWKNVAIVKKYANYSKCVTIPGINSTNVAGFESTRMCPQGLTIAGSYMLISAYDSNGEENSVIYVLNKNTRKLLTVIVLPNQTHAGGICYDGKNVWITYGKKLCTIAFSDVKAAAKSKAIYKEVAFTGTYTTSSKVSFLTYYKSQIWTGDFEYTTKGKLRSYKVTTASDGTKTLTQRSCVTIPAAVQGITFTTNGRLILSRAYGYTNELNIYKPTKTGTTNMVLGKVTKTVTMPALNEEIAISGNYLYVNFESGLPGSLALNHMDRVLAIKLKAVLK